MPGHTMHNNHEVIKLDDRACLWLWLCLFDDDLLPFYIVMLYNFKQITWNLKGLTHGKDNETAVSMVDTAE